MSNYISINLEELDDYMQNLPIQVQFPTIMNEDSLNLEADDVISSESTRRINLFNDRYWLNNKKIPTDVMTISHVDINFLYGKVSHLPTINKKCITAVLVHFAYKISNDENSFTLLFEPVFLKYVDFDPRSLTYLYEIDSSFNRVVYHFYATPEHPEGEFIECIKTDETDEELAWRNNYRGPGTLINRNIDPNKLPSIFIKNFDSESQLFPFQLIYALMKDNNNSNITFKNCMSEYKHNTNHMYKHSLFMSSRSMAGSSGPFAGKQANRSHLCPPCDTFGFTVND